MWPYRLYSPPIWLILASYSWDFNNPLSSVFGWKTESFILFLELMNLISAPWFLTLFLSSMPTESAGNILDCVFYDGSKIIFHLALEVFDRNTKQLASCDIEGMYEFCVTIWT